MTPPDETRRLNKATHRESWTARSVEFWRSVASGTSQSNGGERGAMTRRCTRKAKKGLSRARRRLNQAVIDVGLVDSE